jgi:hypothetical protein
MSALAIAALVLVCIWLGVLTLVVVLLVRQIGLLTVRLSVASQAFSLDNDGPEVGSSLPEEVTSVVPELMEERSYLLLISSSCTPCRELVSDLQGEQRFEEQKIVALVPGHEDQAREMAALLPSGIRVVLDPDAARVAGAIDLESTPFAVEVERGMVTRKVFLHEGAADLVAFVEAGSTHVETKSFVEITEKETIEGR